MKTRVLLAVVCILAIPVFLASSTEPLTSSPMPLVALAGHTVVGAWCECGSRSCICDPGENPTGQNTTPSPNQEKASLGRTLVDTNPADGGEFASALVLVFALYLWSRYRA